MHARSAFLLRHRLQLLGLLLNARTQCGALLPWLQQRHQLHRSLGGARQRQFAGTIGGLLDLLHQPLPALRFGGGPLRHSRGEYAPQDGVQQTQ